MEHDAAARDVRLTHVFAEIKEQHITSNTRLIYLNVMIVTFLLPLSGAFSICSELLYKNSFLLSVWAYGTKTFSYGQDQTDLIYELIL